MDPSISGDKSDVDPMAHSGTVVALRTATGTANVGRGPLRVEQPQPGGSCGGDNPSCPDGFSCDSSGTCSGRSGCDRDSDCPDGVICKDIGDSNTACAVPSCSSDSDCSSGHCEKSGTCEPYVKELGEPREISDRYDDCSISQVSPCNTPRECKMIDGEPECRATSCSDDSDCESDEACDPSDGVCKALGQTDRTCSSDEQCVSRNCQISSSATGTCTTPTFQKVATMSEFKDDSPTYEAKKVSTSFTFHPAHSHTHLDDFLSLRLVEDTTTCKTTRPSYRTSSESQDCTVATNDKVSFCLQDTELFDIEIRSYANLQPERRWLPSVECATHHQGISPGYKDVYGPNLPGQALMLGTPSEVQNQFAGSTYLLEQEVDPSDGLSERQEKNNWAQASVEFPAFDSGEFCSKNADGKNLGVIDCRDYPDVSSVENDMGLETAKARAVCERYAKHYCNDHPTDAICDRYNL